MTIVVISEGSKQSWFNLLCLAWASKGRMEEVKQAWRLPTRRLEVISDIISKGDNRLWRLHQDYNEGLWRRCGCRASCHNHVIVIFIMIKIPVSSSSLPLGRSIESRFFFTFVGFFFVDGSIVFFFTFEDGSLGLFFRFWRWIVQLIFIH